MLAEQDEEEKSFRRIVLVVEYDGTAYAGSQYQKNAPTIQGELEKALSKVTNERARVALAGRTDAGVHAKAQVVSFRTQAPYEPEVFVRALNAHLPEDIAVRSAREMPLSFEVRRQARRRWYRYHIYNGPQRPALLRRCCWHVAQPLDVEAMQKAAQHLVGKHDLAAFAAPSAPANTTRTVHSAQVRRRRSWVILDIEANSFLPQQVRRTVAALVQVGLGKQTVHDFRRLLASAQRGAATLAAPARGLCLMAVAYEGWSTSGYEENANL
ncbi:MAG: tRNA pseudouridine(38-40) synthase TruA [Dehalococcoidia bacterium]